VLVGKKFCNTDLKNIFRGWCGRCHIETVPATAQRAAGEDGIQHHSYSALKMLEKKEEEEPGTSRAEQEYKAYDKQQQHIRQRSVGAQALLGKGRANEDTAIKSNWYSKSNLYERARGIGWEGRF
jgi:hypothetical protein